MPGAQDPSGLLQRVLLLERHQGFLDRAAVGGLASFARQQVERAGSSASLGLANAAGLLEGYRDADRSRRESAVAAALRTLLTETRPQTPSSPLPRGEPSVLPPGRQTKRPETKAMGKDSTVPTSRRPAPREAARSAPKVVHKPEDLDRPLPTLKGMRKATADALARLGVVTVRDLLFYLPRTHYDYKDTRSISRMRLGQKTTLVGTIENVRNNRTRRGVVITTATISDDTGTVAVRWFNQPYLTQRLPVGARIAISGEPDVFNGFIVFQPRDYELIEDADLTHTARLVPIYPLGKGLYQRSLRQLIRKVLNEYREAVEDFLPADLQDRLRLPLLSDAIAGYHFPEDEEQKTRSEQRLAFDELFMVQLGLFRRKREWQQPKTEVAIPIDRPLLDRFCHSLPFALTGAQQRVIEEILQDLSRGAPMSRLLQGDVGSGKTVVAAAALLQVICAGKQGVLMAPTEILAEQHHRTLQNLLAPFEVRCELLIGSTPKARRKELQAAMQSVEPLVVVGTHALIQEGVAFGQLGLVITDEQHRFGVEQRATLRQKGLHPHVLAMTATPIPRTLAMTIYGDLDVSTIEEMPPGRVPPITTWSRTPAEAYGVVRAEVREGHQAFVICPVIEDSMESDMRSVLAEHKELQHLTFPDLRVGLLHGRMKAAEKEATLEAFRRGEYHILVATSVVEVGIDIPNATVMVIRDAHRFGLAQLHQFRGRVGRGGDQAYCVLLSPSEGDDARERLEALTATDNGFDLAEEDLRLRGPGEFWGTRQSGLPALQIAQLGDLPTINLARRAAQDVLERDPELAAPEHHLLLRELQRFWTEKADLS